MTATLLVTLHTYLTLTLDNNRFLKLQKMVEYDCRTGGVIVVSIVLFVYLVVFSFSPNERRRIL
jgi:hypothetical protein